MVSPGVGAGWIVHEDSAMTTEIRIQFWHDGDRSPRQIIDRAMAEFHRVDMAYSSYKPASELSYVNLHAFESPVVVSPEFFTLLLRSIELSELTSGAFDITFQSIGYRYDYRQKIRPDNTQVGELLPLVNFHHLHLDPLYRSIKFEQQGVKIGLGGIAKGHVVERVAAILRAEGIVSAQVTAGGDSRFIGDHNGRPWSVGVQDPRDKSALAAVLPVVDEAVSTSGDYARFFVEDGVRFHHIIDPRTGVSALGVRSATVIGPDAVQTDALSTGVFILGAETGLKLIDRLDGYEAVIIDSEGNLRYSRAFVPSQ